MGPSKFIQTFFILLISNVCLGQLPCDTTNQLSTVSREPIRHRSPIWFTPVARSTQINGVAIGLITVPIRNGRSLTIRGVNVEVNPLVCFYFLYAFGAIVNEVQLLLEKQKHSVSYIGNVLEYREKDSVVETKIYGLNLSTSIVSERTEMDGVSLSIITATENEMNGLEVTGAINKHYCFKGVMIAGMANIATKGKGVQIGLYNKCDNGKVLQIGLLNKIGKRTIPFINLRFRQAKQV